MRLSGSYSAQEFHQLVTYLGRGFVLHPVADVVEFEMANETGEAGAKFVEGWVELAEAVRFSGDVKGGLRNPGTFEGPGEIKIRFRGAIVIQGGVKAGALKFGDVVSDIFWISP